MKQLSKEEKRKLLLRAASGDQKACEEIVNNLEGLIKRLALSLYYKISSGSRTRCFDLDDLMQEGRLGAHYALSKLDLNKLGESCSLTTYTRHWIMQYMRRFIQNNARLIRLPSHVLEEVALLVKVKEDLTSQDRDHRLGITNEELSAATGLSKARVETLQNLPNVDFYLEDLVEGDDGSRMGDFISSDLDPYSRILESEDGFLIHVRQLPEKYREVLLRRVGAQGNKGPQSLKEIGDALSISREGVRQREAKALEMLRNRLGLYANE